MEILLGCLCILWISLLIIMSVRFSAVVKDNHTHEQPLDVKNLPSVSLCIPARNENHALSECLSGAIASNYPKLEILVLDDCSQDKTSQIIRGFSHEGVRFIQGEVPSEGWLGKNNAYDTLYKQAHGKYLVFLSVDTRISEATIYEIVTEMENNSLAMMSILPTRDRRYLASVLFAPLRYFWQLVLSDKTRPPVATSLWAIRSDALQQIDGFNSLKQEVLLENKLATIFAKQHLFHFARASSKIQATYAKHWTSQVQTSVRLLFPLMRRSYMIATLVCAVGVLLIATPIILLIMSTNMWTLPLAYLQIAITFGIYMSYLIFITGNVLFSVLASLLLPVVLLQEIVLVFVSSIQYARGKIDWKGRNICFPSSFKSTSL